MVINAQLEAVSAGIATFEEEFLAQIVPPEGSTFSGPAAPAVRLAYSTGESPKLLSPPSGST